MLQMSNSVEYGTSPNKHVLMPYASPPFPLSHIPNIGNIVEKKYGMEDGN